MVHIYIGDGKGKTTAVLGMALRALGWNKRVYIAHFLKGSGFRSGELSAIKKYRLKIKTDCFKEQTHPIFCRGRKFDEAAVKKSIDKNLVKVERYIRNKQYDFIILDEILNAVGAGLVVEDRIKDIIKSAGRCEIALTGRSATRGIMELADYVSRIKKVKHPFDKKTPARKAVEY